MRNFIDPEFRFAVAHGIPVSFIASGNGHRITVTIDKGVLYMDGQLNQRGMTDPQITVHMHVVDTFTKELDAQHIKYGRIIRNEID